MRNDSRAAWAATDAGLFKTTDGQQWTRSLNELKVSSVAVDGADEQRVYAAASGKLFATTDGGQNWTAMATPFPVGIVAADPYSGVRLYISASHNYDQTFATTTDRGQSWRTSGWLAAFPFLAPDPSTPGRRYASVATLLQSNDYGQTWTDLGPNPSDLFGVLPDGAHTASIRRVMAAAADPTRPGDVHTCVEARWIQFDNPEDVLGRFEAGLIPGWASRIAGLWAAGSLPGDQPCTAVVRLPEKDATLYAAGTKIYRRSGLVTRRVDAIADLGSTVRSLAATRAAE
jgi:hypothetical protein